MSLLERTVAVLLRTPLHRVVRGWVLVDGHPLRHVVDDEGRLIVVPAEPLAGRVVVRRAGGTHVGLAAPLAEEELDAALPAYLARFPEEWSRAGVDPGASEQEVAAAARRLPVVAISVAG